MQSNISILKRVNRDKALYYLSNVWHALFAAPEVDMHTDYISFPKKILNTVFIYLGL